jgi:hypothetical protein
VGGWLQRRGKGNIYEEKENTYRKPEFFFFTNGDIFEIVARFQCA